MEATLAASRETGLGSRAQIYLKTCIDNRAVWHLLASPGHSKAVGFWEMVLKSVLEAWPEVYFSSSPSDSVECKLQFFYSSQNSAAIKNSQVLHLSQGLHG